MMRVKIIEYANEEKINKECEKLAENGNIILDVIVTHPTQNHYVTYVVIKYKKGFK